MYDIASTIVKGACVVSLHSGNCYKQPLCPCALYVGRNHPLLGLQDLELVCSLSLSLCKLWPRFSVLGSHDWYLCAVPVQAAAMLLWSTTETLF